MLQLEIAPHPLLHLRAFTTDFPAPLGDLTAPAWLVSLLAVNAESPLTAPDDAARAAVRDLLRHGGFKPTGRSKPASEYLLRAATEGALGSINVAVDAGNAVSLHSGLPISVVDLDRARTPLRVGIAQAGDAYVFNTSGQVIDLEGLLCLFDAEGPCANAVKDAQRTKTSAATRRTLSIVWGPRALAERVDAATTWYRQLLERVPASTEPVA
ncbi:MAG: phenylalanine--tRNA ligase beta subunit-related protein [Myxococcales bacterium]|jgi:DNA/RNA-binding domain of Phe-tRNA-synthetase-like protein